VGIQDKDPGGALVEGRMAWSLRLLRQTRSRVSVFCLRLVGIDRPRAEGILAVEVGGSAVVDWLTDQRVTVMIIDPPGEGPAAAMVERVARRLLSEAAAPGGRAHVELVALHGPADEIGEPEDLLMRLAAAPAARCLAAE
jgi:hypothetical protein